MQKLWQKHQKFMKGNAGFSLVELIIVIAIMAALVAILAPQYLKYVERSRVSADQTTLDEVIKAAKVAASDPDVSLGAADVTLRWSDTAKNGTYVFNTTDAATDAGIAIVAALGNSAGFTLKSNSGVALGNISITIKVADKSFAVAYDDSTAVYTSWK